MVQRDLATSRMPPPPSLQAATVQGWQAIPLLSAERSGRGERAAELSKGQPEASVGRRASSTFLVSRLPP